MGANSRASASGKMNDQLDYGTIEGFEILPWLETAGCEATPVASFLHSHLSWRFNHNMHEGLIVEASYKDENGTTAFWLAIVTKVFGYYLKLRWLGDTPKASTFWKVVGLYKPPVEGRSDDRIFHVGYAVSNQKQFKAPRSVPKPQQGWRRFLAEHLESAAALTENIQNNIEKEIESPLSIGQKAEAMDITNILAVAPVIVEENRGGRLKLCYADRRRNPGRDSETWLHKFSPEILPPGMATIVGMAITSTAEYYEESWKHTVEEWLTGSIGNFPRRFVPDFLERELRAHRFNEGAKLEVLDMLAPDKIRVGTILEVLDDFWLNIKIECASSGKSKDYVVCLHATSDRLLPAGWAVDNGFKDYFLPPRGFSWDNCEKVPPELLQRKISSHAFMPQQLLEVIGVARTNLIYIAQIKAVKEPLMLVRYFGWEPEEYAFFPISSLDIYPVGWCDSVRHRLQAPRKNMEPIRF